MIKGIFATIKQRGREKAFRDMVNRLLFLKAWLDNWHDIEPDTRAVLYFKLGELTGLLMKEGKRKGEP